MKYVLIMCASLLFSVASQAQTPSTPAGVVENPAAHVYHPSDSLPDCTTGVCYSGRGGDAASPVSINRGQTPSEPLILPAVAAANSPATAAPAKRRK